MLLVAGLVEWSTLRVNSRVDLLPLASSRASWRGPSQVAHDNPGLMILLDQLSRRVVAYWPMSMYSLLVSQMFASYYLSFTPTTISFAYMLYYSAPASSLSSCSIFEQVCESITARQPLKHLYDDMMLILGEIPDRTTHIMNPEKCSVHLFSKRLRLRHLYTALQIA